MRPLSRLSPEQLSRKYRLEEDSGIPVETIMLAYQFFDSKESMLIGFSGKMAAGKDSVAPLVFSQLKKTPREDSFGADLKTELNNIISLTADNDGNELQSARDIASFYNVTLEESSHLVSLFANEIKEGKLKTSYDRTLGSRLALQYWATEVRRKRDPLYWVKPVIGRSLIAASKGESTQITDVRFRTEVWGIIDSAGLTVRLDVSEESQRERILKRDGLEVSEKAKSHSSETELDDFENFTVRVNTDLYTTAENVAEKAVYELQKA